MFARHGIILFLFLSLVSCNSFKKVENNHTMNLFYIDLEAVVDYLIKKDGELGDKISAKKKLLSTAKNIESVLNKPEVNYSRLNNELQKTMEKIEHIDQYEARKKKEIYGKIDVAVRNIAKNMKADYIFNLGDEVVFAKKEYDVTEDVLKELMRLEKRVAPASR